MQPISGGQSRKEKEHVLAVRFSCTALCTTIGSHSAGWPAARRCSPAQVARDDPEETRERLPRALPLDPKYIDVIVQRWQTLAGKDATLDGDGRTFEEIAEERQKGAA